MRFLWLAFRFRTLKDLLVIGRFVEFYLSRVDCRTNAIHNLHHRREHFSASELYGILCNLFIDSVRDIHQKEHHEFVVVDCTLYRPPEGNLNRNTRLAAKELWGPAFGSNFGSSQDSGQIWLGTAPAQVISWNDSQVVATSRQVQLPASRVLQGGVLSNA